MNTQAIIAAKHALAPQLDLDDWNSDMCWKTPVTRALGPRVPPTRSLTTPLSLDIPLLLTPNQIGFSDHWKNFPTPAEFKGLIGDHELMLSGSDNDGASVTVPCIDFIDYFLGQCGEDGDDDPLCVFDRAVLCVETTGKVAEKLCARYTTPSVNGLDFDASVFDSLAFDLRPLMRYLLIGPTRSGTHIHQDPDGTGTWNVVTHGCKRWALMSPLVPASLAYRESPPKGYDWSIADWFQHEWPSIKTQVATMGLPVYDFEHTVGEMVYVPPGWWHAVINVESSVAVSHNVLHKSTMLKTIATAQAKGIEATAAVIEAFKLADNDTNTGIAAWLTKIQVPV
eukprot:m.205077 g.205077  ORF g.205077 m.205077 type:complete len:339 (+) comp32905_c0_seq1:112-1128(+)